MAKSLDTYQEMRKETGEGVVTKIAPSCETVGVINPHVLTHAGHYSWLHSLPGVPPYLVPDSSGHLDSPSLSSFYMFFTMIILLQVDESQ